MSIANNRPQSTQVVPFFFEQHQVRVSTDETGEFWFVAKDIAELLGYSDTQAMTRRLDDDEFKTDKLSGMNMKSILVNESGLFTSILGSNKQEAKYFKRWVTHEVLPSIRKTGGYDLSIKFKPTVKDELFFLKEAAKILRLPESAIQNGIAAISQKYGLEQAYLPNYSNSPLTMAMGDLLKKHGSSLSTVRVNPILIKLGILEETERRASKGEIKTFKSITKKGLEFGENEKARQNTHETQPRWYVHKFPELLDLIHENIDILKVQHLEVVQ